MHLETKLELMKRTDSYWTLLPYELREIILQYKESQELIEWRESEVSRALCREIRAHGQLRHKWFIGPVECRFLRSNGLQQDLRLGYMMIFGHFYYHGYRKRIFLDYTFSRARAQCDYVKDRL